MVCLVDCIYTETTKLLKRKTFPKIYVIRLPYDTNRQYYFKNINFVVKYKRCFVTERQKGISIWFCYNYFRFFFFWKNVFYFRSHFRGFLLSFRCGINKNIWRHSEVAMEKGIFCDSLDQRCMQTKTLEKL